MKGSDLRAVTQAPGIDGKVAIDSSTGATRIFVGAGTTAPHTTSAAHHHGEAETAAYVLSGRMRVRFGDGFADSIEAGPGDFVYIPPFVPHIEENPGDEPMLGLVARTPWNIVVPLSDHIAGKDLA